MGRGEMLRGAAGLVGVAFLAAVILPDVVEPLRSRSALLHPTVDSVFGWVSLGLISWALLSPRSAPEAARGPADSLLLGAFGLLLAVCSAFTLIVALHLSISFESGLVQGAITMGFCTPPLGLLNLLFSHRDERHGSQAQARLGLLLSGLAVLVAALPFALAD